LFERDRDWFEMAMTEITQIFNLKRAPSLSIIARKISNPDLDGFVALVAAKVENSEIVPWLSFPGQHIFRSRKALSINDILISDNYQLFDYRYTYNEILLYDLNIKFPVKLNTARDSITAEDQLDYLKTMIFEHLSILIKEFTRNIGTINNDRKYNINNQMLYHLLHSKRLHSRHSECKKIVKGSSCIQMRFSKTGTSCMTAKDFRRDKIIILVNLPGYLDEKVIDDLIDKNASFKKDKKYILNYVGDMCRQYAPTMTEKGIRKFVSKSNTMRYSRIQTRLEKIAPCSEK
jgi:hypothetical protein